MDAAPKITWIIDSSKVESVHRNAPGLSMKDSYLGHLERRRDSDGDLNWGFVVNGVFSMARSYADARAKLAEVAVKNLPPADHLNCGKCQHPTHIVSCVRGNCHCSN